MPPRVFRLQTFVLLLLVPGILLVTAIFGAQVYRDLYGIIMRGFDRKLYALSTVTAEFITGEEHARVLQQRRVDALAFDSATGGLFGRDAETGAVLRIDPGMGGAVESATTPAVALTAATVDPLGRRFAIERGALTVTTNGETHSVGTLVLVTPADSVEGIAETREPIVVNALAWDHGNGVLVGAADGLVRIDTATAEAFRDGYNQHFRSEALPEYVRHVLPMRRIRQKKDITYLYTQVVYPDGTIEYGYDATVGEDHSPPGSLDALPAAEIPGTRSAMARDGVHLSRIQQWEQWGLLKSAFAPIRTADGTVNAMSGADVNISIIAQKTRGAIGLVGLVAIITILLGGVVSLFVSRRLVDPLNAVKDGALRVAAGDYGYQIPPQPLTEVDELARHFNRMSSALRETVDTLTRSNRDVDAVRRRRELEFALGTRAADGVPAPFEAMMPDAPLEPGGYITHHTDRGPQLLAWFGAPAQRPLDGLRLRASIADSARRLLRVHAHDWDALRVRLDGLFLPAATTWVLLDAAERRIQWIGDGSAVAILNAAGKQTERSLEGTGSLDVASGEGVVIRSRNAHVGLTAA